MNAFLIGALIAILVYSLILTISVIYKDNSGYFILSDLDVVLAGPICWILIILIRVIIRPIFSLFPKKEKNRKPKSEKFIKKMSKKSWKITKAKNTTMIILIFLFVLETRMVISPVTEISS